MRAASRYEHKTPWAAASHRGTGVRLPPLPTSRRAGFWLEGQEVELAIEDVKEFLSLMVQVSSDVKAGQDVDHLEEGETCGLLVAHF